MTGAPTITAVIAAYNSERWIAETLESILGQSDPAEEVVVVDDGSWDDTAKVIETYDDHIRLIQQENRGSAGAYARAFRAAQSEYVAECGHDDLWHPRKLEWQREALQRHPQIDIAFGHLKFFGQRTGDYGRPPGEGIMDLEAFRPAMYQANHIGAPTAIIRRSLYDALGGFREEQLSEDYDFWMRSILAGACFYYDPRVLAFYRDHGENASRPSLRLAEYTYEVHHEYAPSVDRRLARGVLARDLRVIARHQLEAGDARRARQAYIRSFRSMPSVRAGLAALVLTTSPGRRFAVRRASGGGSLDA